MDISTIFNPALVMTAPAQQRVAESFTQWLVDTASKKPLPDLDVRLAKMQNRLRSLATSLKVEMVMGSPVVSMSGDAHSTWCLLKRGSSWFGPHPNPELAVVVAVMG